MDERLPKKTEKPWGYELLYALTPRYAGKIIFVEKGKRLSLQYHNEKDECMYVLSGRMTLEMGTLGGKTTYIECDPGYCVHITPRTRHRVEALEDLTILEVSTPELNDVERLSDDYGRVTSV
jgi:mannose-6-phosphate isomerase